CLSSSIMPDARQLHPFPTRRSSDLAAYQEAGFTVGAIASRNVEKTKKIAERYGIGKVHETPETLIADPAVEILDIAYPPDLQPRSEEHTSELQSRENLVCRLLLEKK